MSNSLGEFFRITVFGESHGSGIGVVIDGCPAGLEISREDIQKAVDRRKPRTGAGQTARREPDEVEILSGIFEGRTTGAGLALMVRNRDADSEAYRQTRLIPRPGHADYTAFIKYGGFNDYRGGGAFSGRVTVALVMAGAVALKLLKNMGVEILSHTRRIGSIQSEITEPDLVRRNVEGNPLRCADVSAAKAMQVLIDEAVKAGDSLGGIVECLVLNLPAGLGEPYFDSLEGQLARAYFAIPAVKGVEFGDGFKTAEKKGSENNDAFILAGSRIGTASNHAGGILGGISTGMPVVARIAVKPTPSIALPQKSINLKTLESEEIVVRGRHDSCIVPRAAVVVEAVTAVVLCDFALKAGVLKRVIK
ncbi:MAG TPA: chorismate synthase [Dehalococcoidales bacterium]|nr:chorismate synthase [Dehalococcoidales bacterium]